MPRTEIISSEEEDSVWEYRSQAKKIKLTPDSRFTSIKSERENLTQTTKPRQRTRKIVRKDSDSQLKSLPVLNGSNRLSKTCTEDGQDDFKPYISMTQPSVVKKGPLNRKSVCVKDDPDKSQIMKKAKSKRRTVRKIKCKIEEQATPNEKIRSGRCRVCQFPFSALSRVETPSWHEEVCLEVPYSSKEQCSSGVNCCSTIASHYKKFRHTALSRSQHKYDKTRPVATSVDIQNAKMKLEFDAKPADSSIVLKVPSSTLDCIIELEDSSEENNETINESHTECMETKDRLSQSENSLAAKKRYDQVKRNSLKILMRQNMKTIMKQLESPEVQDKMTVGKKSSASITSTNSAIKTEKGYNSKCSEADGLLSSKSCGKSEIVNQSRYQTLTLKSEKRDDGEVNFTNELKDGDDLFEEDMASEKCLTKVSVLDLLETESSNSVQDIDNVTDNSRSITEMLKDVFGENDAEDTDKQITDTGKDPRIMFEDEFSNGSSNDTDILQTGIPFSQLPKSSSFIPEACPSQKHESDSSKNFVQNDFSVISDSLFENSVKGCNQTTKSPEIDKECKASSKLVKAASVTYESLDDTCSRDSTKGFFARKQEEIKLKKSGPGTSGNFQEPKATTSNSIDVTDKQSCLESDLGERFIVEANKENDTKLTIKRVMDEPACQVLLKIVKSLRKNKKTGRSDKQDQNDLNDKKIPETNISTVMSDLKDKNIPQATVESDLNDGNITETKTSKKSAYKSPFQREIEAITNARIESVTVETDSSDDEKMISKHIEKKYVTSEKNRKETSNVCKNKKIDKPSQKASSFAKSKGNTHQQKSSSKEKLVNGCTSENEKTTTSRVESHKDKSITSAESSSQKSQVCGGATLDTGKSITTADSSLQKSHVCVDSIPKSPVTNVRTVEEDGNLPAGFFSEETDDMFDNDGDDDTQNFAPGNFSECEEDVVDHDLCTEADNQQTGALSSNKSCTTNFVYQDYGNRICSSNQTFDSNNFCSNNCESSADSADIFDVVAEKVKEIQKNALEILMQTSKALQKKSMKSEMTRIAPKDVPKSTCSRNVNEFLMSNRGKSSNTSTRSREKVESVPSPRNVEENLNEPTTTYQRKCPFYKKIPGTSLTVDAFKYGNIPDCKAYILSHFHYDHYVGLNKSFCHPLYCSQITGNLVIKKIGVKQQYVHTLPLNTPTVIEDVEITLLEANHCPGAVLILFKLRTGKVFLHTGDFRACEEMEAYPELQNLRIHSLYLDTTYCDPQYDFPSQKEVVKYAIKVAVDAVRNNPSTLIVCGSYTIGKERIFRGIAEELDCKICVTRGKKSVIDCLEDGWLKARTSLVWNESQLHVLPMAKLNFMGLKEHLLKNGKKCNAVLGIKPTGWTYNKKLISLDHIKPEVNKENVKVFGLPYSEHSSFLELKRFVQFTKPDKILPTVNNWNYHSRKKMEAIFEAWMEEVRGGRPSTSHKQPSVALWAV